MNDFVEPSCEERAATVTRPELLHEGLDRNFRSFIHSVLGFAERIVGIRNGFGQLLGLSGLQYTMLTAIAYLQTDEGVRAVDLAGYLDLNEKFIAAEAIRLVDRGILERAGSAILQEAFVLSRDGRTLLRNLAPVQTQVNDALFECLSEQDFALVSRIFARLVECAKQAKKLRDNLDEAMLLPAGSSNSRGANIDSRAFRDGLGHFATGVAVVTAEAPDGHRVGLTISSFSSVSLDPPLVLFSVARHVRSLAALEASQRYAVNILRADQADISNQFANALGDKWRGVKIRRWTDGCPLLAESLAAFECVPFATYDGGDHVIFVGRVVRFEAESSSDPLLFFRGRYLQTGKTDSVEPDSQ